MLYLSLFGNFIKLRWKSQIEYPMPFVMGILAQALSYGIDFLTMYIMIAAFKTIAGWQPMEVLLLYALSVCSYGLGASFTFNTMNELPDMVRTGSFNDVLVKPVDPLFYTLFSNFNVGYVSHIGLSVVVMVACFISLGISLSFLQVLWLIVVILSGGVIQAALMLLFTMPSIVFISNNPLSTFLWKIRDFSNYPLSIFGTPLQLIFTVMIPIGFVNFYPAQSFLGKSDFGVFPPVIQYMAPATAVLLFGITALLWRVIINKYESTGT